MAMWRCAFSIRQFRNLNGHSSTQWELNSHLAEWKSVMSCFDMHLSNQIAYTVLIRFVQHSAEYVRETYCATSVVR